MADIIRFPLFGGKLGVYGTDSFAYNAKNDLGTAEMKRLSILDKDEREQILLNRVSSLILNKLYGYGNLHFYDENGEEFDIKFKDGKFEFADIHSPANIGDDFKSLCAPVDGVSINRYEIDYGTAWGNKAKCKINNSAIKDEFTGRFIWNVYIRLITIDNGDDLFIALWDGYFEATPSNNDIRERTYVRLQPNGEFEVHNTRKEAIDDYLKLNNFKRLNRLNAD